jgi:hypothetical protein
MNSKTFAYPARVQGVRESRCLVLSVSEHPRRRVFIVERKGRPGPATFHSVWCGRQKRAASDEPTVLLDFRTIKLLSNQLVK